MTKLPIALSLVSLALVHAGCAPSAPSGADEPRAAGPSSDVEALESAIARLERRQLEHIERQRALEAKVDALSGEASGGAEPARARAARPARRPDRPDPSAVYAVPVGDSASVGPDDALVTIVEAFEFACAFCNRARATLAQVREEYGGDVRIVYKHFLVHPSRAKTPALAFCAARAQSRHEAMMERIWEQGFANNDLGEANMKRIAQGLGLDMDQFEQDMSGDACSERVSEDVGTMRRFGTRGTPNFYINGRSLRGAQPIHAFRRVIDEELDKARERVDDGTAPSDYYREFVLGRGKSSL